jgi:hypothetical protein
LVLWMETELTEMPVIEIDTKTEKSLTTSDLKKALMRLLMDTDIRRQLLETVRSEEALRESIAESYG